MDKSIPKRVIFADFAERSFCKVSFQTAAIMMSRRRVRIPGKRTSFKVTESKTRKSQQINQVQPLVNQMPLQPPRPQPLAYQQPNNMTYGYHCPRCSSQLLPHYERKISTAGWVVFAILLVIFFPLFWIGLLIKEDVRVCPVCSFRIN